MGVSCILWQVGKDEFDSLWREPESIYRFMDKIHEEMRAEKEDDPVPASRLDLDKAWHGLHYLLEDLVSPVAASVAAERAAPDELEQAARDEDDHPWMPGQAALFGSKEIGGEFLHIAPARGLSPGDVVALDEILATVTVDALSGNFDPPRMMDQVIYPTIWHRGAESLSYLLAHWDALKEFIHDSANDGKGLVIFLTP